MPTFLWLSITGFVLEYCPVCAELYGYDEKEDGELQSIFTKDCKIKRILQKNKFPIEEATFEDGVVTVDKARRGFDLRRELQLRLKIPDPRVDIDVRRLGKLVDQYGRNVIRLAIFIDRFQIINLSKHPELKYLHYIRWVPAFMTPYAPHGIIQAVHSRESEKELERLFFLGGSRIEPAVELATAVG